VLFDIGRGEAVAVVGESGSGKSVTALSVLRLLPYPPASHPGGRILFGGVDLLAAGEATLRQVRGAKVTMIFQEPMTSLNPLHTIERQIGEILEVHQAMGRTAARLRTLELLADVGIRDAESRLGAYPHQLSGGQRQRVMIAMAIANDPDLLIADEPTTALDVTVQAQMLLLLRDLQQDFGTAIVLITHDLGVVAGLCDQVVVLYGGRVMEQGNAQQLFKTATHPYTLGLLKAVPRMDRDDASLLAIPGAPPNMARLPKGCPFSERCTLADATCHNTLAALQPIPGITGHLRACHRSIAQVQNQPIPEPFYA